MQRRHPVAVALALALALLLGAGAPAGLAATTATDQGDDFYRQLEVFTDALSIVQSDYVEAPQPRELVYGALKGMLAGLDPYSQFMDPDDYNEMKVETEGEFGGLGVEITIKDNLLTVITPIDDTPASRAGLKSGDRIVKIDGKPTRDITLTDAVKKLRGKPGTQVAVTIWREGAEQLLDVPLTREIIKIRSVREPTLLESRIGYVRIAEFLEHTPQDLAAAFETLTQQGMDSLILDLRNNPGGLLDVAVAVSEQFLEPQALIVSTRGRLRNQNQEFRARRHSLPADLPLVVLVNEGSASASEIVAGAIQDHHRGVVLGAKTFGKGSVQTIIPLKDGSALRLTTSKYFTPHGRSIHGEGIHPDVVVPFEEPPAAAKTGVKSKDVFDQVDNGAARQGASDARNTVDVAKDNQLARAVDLLKGIKVYRAMPP